MTALTMTLLPEPVAPAMSRWGILARSTAWAVPATSRPRANVSFDSVALNGDLLEDPPEGDDVEVLVRDLDADGALARDRRLDPEAPGGQGHREVVGEGLDPAHPDVDGRLDLVLGDDRAGVAADDLGLIPKLASFLTMISSFRSWAALLPPGSIGAATSSSSSSGGRRYSIRSLVGGESPASVMSSRATASPRRIRDDRGGRGKSRTGCSAGRTWPTSAPCSARRPGCGRRGHRSRRPRCRSGPETRRCR